MSNRLSLAQIPAVGTERSIDHTGPEKIPGRNRTAVGDIGQQPKG